MAVEYSVLLFCGAVLRVPPAGGRGPDDEHRNSVRVRDRVRRGVGDAGEASGPAPSLPYAVGAGGAGPRHDRQLGADVLAGRIELASADHLAGDGTGDLLRLRTQAQPPSERLRLWRGPTGLRDQFCSGALGASDQLRESSDWTSR